MVLVHISGTPLKIINDMIQNNDFKYKPQGFWYSPDNTWLENHYGLENLYDNDGLFKYKIEVQYTNINKPDINKVLKIDNINDFDKFTFKYGKAIDQTRQFPKIGINWFDVSNDFGGIEIIPFPSKRTTFDKMSKSIKEKYTKKLKVTNEETILWISSFEIASGCVWNTKCFIDVSPLI